MEAVLQASRAGPVHCLHHAALTHRAALACCLHPARITIFLVSAPSGEFLKRRVGSVLSRSYKL